ncbi:MAG: hypothetical protein ACREIC_05705 [Limisphaerales bacterium]
MKTIKFALNSMAEQASCRVFVANNTAHRKVLIVADEPSINNLLLLVKKLDTRRVAASTAGLSGVYRRSFDTAILDMRCSQGRPASRGNGFGEVWSSMTGRVLVINAEVNNPKTLEMAERFIYHRHTLAGLLYDLADVARSVIGHSPAAHRI